jgi:hypothetical protein
MYFSCAQSKCNFIKGLFKIVFERSKNAFNTQKTRLKKKKKKWSFSKKIKSVFKGLESLKLTKKYF